MASPSRSLASTVAAWAALATAPLLLSLALWITDEELWQNHPLGFVGLWPARLLLLVLATAALLVAFVPFVVRARRSLLARRCAAAAFAAAFTLLLLEIAFMFVPRSHNVGYTLGSRVWFDWYWKPTNSLGYRDAEHVRVPGKRLLFAVGDSFTAGGGIAHVAARYTDLLEARHPGLHVLNLGMNGSDTADEFRRVQAHPLQPDVLVLQYYPNDVEGAAARAGRRMPAFTPYEDIPSVKARFLVRSSFLLNFAYWELPHTDSLAYVRFLEAALADPEVSARHQQDLEQFCTWAAMHGVPLVVVLFPFLNDVERSRTITGPVKDLFARHRVPVVDVADLVGDLEPRQRTANNQDAHPSAVVHERVAEALWRALDPH